MEAEMLQLKKLVAPPLLQKKTNGVIRRKLKSM